MRSTVIATTVAVITVVILGGTVTASGQELTGVSFPNGRIAFFDAQRVVSESVTGQAAFAELEAFRTDTATEVERRSQSLAAEQRRLQTESALLSQTARLSLERSIQSTALNIQRLLEDAQAELLGLQRAADYGFQVKLLPAVEAVALEHDVHFVFNRLTYPILWADPAYDLTERIIERLDAN